MAVVPARVQPFYYGTPGGAEVDLILEFSNTEKWVVEIKRCSSPLLSKGFYVACEDVKPLRLYIVYSGSDTFAFGEGVTAISLPALMEEILNQG